jgi:cyclic di-GMP phosphodiesterase Gmr
MTAHDDFDNLQLETHFGTPSPYWQVTTDSNALRLSGTEEGCATFAVELTSAQAAQIRALSGVTSSLALDVMLFGAPFKLHLVGRKTDSQEWSGTAAHYGDTGTVARDLENGLNFAEQIVSEVNSLVVILDTHGKIKRFNRLCEEVTGMGEADLVGKNAHDLFIPASEREASRQNIDGFFRHEEAYEVLRPIHTRQGVRMIHWRNKIVRSGSGVDESYLVCSGVDVTEEQRAKARLEELATTDVLTGLPNRHSIEERITHAVSGPQAAPFGLIFLDLDNFKKINDHYGHMTGDVLIAQVASAIAETLDEGDVVARLGGDEFLVMVHSGDQSRVEATAQRILERMKLPFNLTRAEVYSGCSIGIAMFPEHGDTREELVRSADTAMYVAKESGRRMYRVFSAEMNNKVSEYMWLESNMRRALAEGQFELHYQPKVSLRTEQVASVEALVRWNHPECGMISPARFIPYAEESGLIVALGKWVLEEAARQAGLWKRSGLNVRIAVNLSARQFREPALLEDFLQAIRVNAIEPSLLDLELTETSVIEDEEQALALIDELRRLGAQVHMDDFGTGYSSLSQLARLPLDAVKLDGSFIKTIHSDAKARALVRSMVAVGEELGLGIVAECVETEEQAEFLRSIGVDCAQGWLFGKAMPAVDFEAWLQARRARQAVEKAA